VGRVVRAERAALAVVAAAAAKDRKDTAQILPLAVAAAAALERDTMERVTTTVLNREKLSQVAGFKRFRVERGDLKLTSV
jgi:hypothetical protein